MSTSCTFQLVLKLKVNPVHIHLGPAILGHTVRHRKPRLILGKVIGVSHGTLHKPQPLQDQPLISPHHCWPSLQQTGRQGSNISPSS